MVKAMWIAVLTYFGLIAIAPPVMGDWRDHINWVDVIDNDMPTNDETDPNYDADADWWEFEFEAYNENAAEFDRLFAAVEFKVAKNGRSMVKSANGGGFKFAPKSA